MHRGIRSLLTLAVAISLGGAARVHTALVSSDPADGSSLPAPPDAITLQFTEPVPLRSTTVILVSVAGDTLRTTIDTAADQSTEVRAVPESPPAGGAFLVRWSTLGSDGHAVEGTFAFQVDAAAVADSAATGAAPMDGHGEMEMGGAMDEMSGMSAGGEPIPFLTAFLRAFAIGSLGTLAALSLFLGWFGDRGDTGLEGAARTVAIATAVFVPAHLIAWVAYVRHDLPLPVVDLLLYVMPGRVEAIRTGLALVAAASVLVGRHWRSAGIFGALALLASGFVGHSMAIRPTLLVPSRAIHILGMAIWAGGLVALLRSAAEPGRYQRLASRVSTGSLLAVIAIFVTGVIHLLVFPTPIPQLLVTFYGALILAKLLGFGVLVGLGARNRFSLLPRLPDEAASAALRRAVAWEIGVMAVVVLMTGVLVYSMLPE